MAGGTRLFTYSTADFIYDVCRAEGPQRAAVSDFDSALRSGWAERMERGLFRYRLTQLETRLLPGECGYVAQLNIQRGTERRKPQVILSIRQRFDPTLFNFNQIHPEEVLFEMRRADGGGRSCLVIVNVSPLEFGHCLLVPEPSLCLPQILTPLAVQFAVDSVFLSVDPGYRVGFNSLGAFASVNHLHLHGYYLNHTLRIELARTEPILPEMNLYRLSEFPPGFMFYTENPAGTQDMAATVCRLTDILAERNTAHNVFITRGCHPDSEGNACFSRPGVRIFIWPRVSCFGAKEESALNVALCELAGHLPFKNRTDFESIDEAGVKEIVQNYMFTDQEFTELEKYIVQHL